MSGLHALNTTFLMSAFALSYLCLDPLIKVTYALRCFYGEALTTGADLKTELNIFRAKRKLMVVMLVAMFWVPALKAHGSEQLELLPAEAPGISSTELDHAIDEVLERREFVWRLPKEKPPLEESTQSGPLISVLRWILEKIENAFKSVSGWLENLVDWLDKMWPRENTPETSADRDWRPVLRFLLIAMAAVLVAILLVYAAKFWRGRRGSYEESDSDSDEETPDLRDDGIKADELPANRWIDLAKELMAKGEYRLAMRALYLATLSYLAERELVDIEIYKSNRDYDRELQRRSSDRKDLIVAFSETVTVIDRVWYGMRKISQSDVESYLAEQERIIALAEK